MRLRELSSGALVVALGLFFCLFAMKTLPIGTADAMGAGYFPTVLGGILVALGIAIALQRGDEDEAQAAPVPWRGIALTVGAVVFCGATQVGLGLVPSLALTVMLSAFASDEMTPARAVMLSLGLTAFCVLVFKFGLGMAVPLFGPWVGG